MSGNIEADRDRYVSLMKSFVGGEISADTFVRQFLALRRQDLDKDMALRDSWGTPRDQELVRALQDGALSDREFQRKWGELWGYDPASEWLKVFEAVFTDVDRFAPNDDSSDDATGDTIGSTELRRRVAAHLETLQQ